MTDLRQKLHAILNEKKMGYLATTDGRFIDNAMVAFYAEDFNLYFGTFTDTLKGRNIEANPFVAVCIDKLQIHGKARQIKHSSPEYHEYVKKYLEKFPNYRFYFELEKNELYRITPLVIWFYDSSQGTMHRDNIIFDEEYYQTLHPYEVPDQFIKREEKN